MRSRLGVGIGDDDVAQDADRRAAFEFGLRRWPAPPRLASAALKASILRLANAVGPLAVKCMPCSPAQVAPIVFDEPYQNGGCGCCSGRIGIGTSRIVEILAVIAELVVGQRLR